MILHLRHGPGSPTAALTVVLAGLATLALLGLGACASVGAAAPSPTAWHRGSVVALLPAGAIPDGVDPTCAVNATAPAPAAERAGPVAIVRLRVGRAPYEEAFQLPADTAVQVGDPVRVQMGSCGVKPVAGAR